MNDKDHTENCEQTKPVGVERALGGTTCLFCDEERSLKPNCTKQRWKVCDNHFMVTCPVCGHEAFWMEGMKSGDYYACFSLSCNWTDRVPPNGCGFTGLSGASRG